MIHDLMDEEGENRAVRTFLMQHGLPGLTVGAMRSHMQRSGWEGCWPDWVAKSHGGEHLTKAGAQLWIRHLFSLEGAELTTRCRAEGGGTSENMVVGKPAKNDSKTAETRMNSGFDGGGEVSAPAAGTDKDAERYRLLTRGDIIQPDDEFLSDDCASWLTDPSGIFVGLEYLPGALKTSRRKIAAIGTHTNKENTK